MAPTMERTFRIRLGKDEGDGLWYADVLDLQGCYAFGATEEEALNNLVPVVSQHLAFRFENAIHKKFSPEQFGRDVEAMHPSAMHEHQVTLTA